ncbi:Flp pilus assembly complex ATPase component TadA [bacterium]|nr:Flp pilus assembly complex ATPase component TadA [bacterium]
MTKSQLTQVLLARKKNNRSLQYNCAAMNYTDESLLTHFIAEQYKGFPVINLSQIDNIPKNTLDIIPFKYIQHYLVLPFRLEGRKVFTAMANPRNVNVINELQFLVGHTVVPFVAGEYFLINAIDKYYKSEASESDMGQTLEEISQEDELEFIEEKDDDEKTNRIDEIEGVQGPVVKLVNLILKEAIAQKASDVHIEPYENELRVRFRVDGTLITVLNPSPKYKNGISSRIKIMSRLNISERRLPQDGRFKIKMDKKCVDFRVSTFPGSFGEKVVLRLLDKSNLEVDISKLGMDINDQKALSEAMHKSKGMILVTGPTGSGKTTTLYSVLHGLNDGTRNISTAEDPIEYNISGINQFQMNPRIGLDFAKALRAFLRQDPDIIMVGEIRDLETAQIAVKAALTGHLVLSTLHTNSATETITRLLDMNVEPFLVATSISLIIAQRLMRRICPSCKEETSLENMHLEVLEKKGIDISGVRFYKGKGCSNCNYAGYKGRVAIYEVLPIRHELQEMIIKGESSLKIQSKAEEFGLQTLQKRGIEKVMDGTTSVDEWLRVAV